MAVSVAQFRADYPEFASTTDFPNSGVQYWMTLAYQMLPAARWGRQLDIGAELFVAHYITLEARAKKESANGGTPGQNTGPLNSKSVDKVSMGYDTGASSVEDGGHWNLTTYGTRFLQLVNMFGAGPLFIGVGSSPALSGLGWSGPNVTPGFTNFS